MDKMADLCVSGPPGSFCNDMGLVVIEEEDDVETFDAWSTPTSARVVLEPLWCLMSMSLNLSCVLDLFSSPRCRL